MEDVVIYIFGITALGAALSWLGRSWAALLVSYFVVGLIAGIVIFLGMLSYEFALDANKAAEQLNNPIGHFILNIFDLKTFGLFLEAFDLETRKKILVWLSVFVIIVVTLPFVTFSNAIYSALTADRATKAVESAKDDLEAEMKSASVKDEDYHREQLSELKKISDDQGEKLRIIKGYAKDQSDLMVELINQISVVKDLINNGNR